MSASASCVLSQSKMRPAKSTSSENIPCALILSTLKLWLWALERCPNIFGKSPEVTVGPQPLRPHNPPYCPCWPLLGVPSLCSKVGLGQQLQVGGTKGSKHRRSGHAPLLAHDAEVTQEMGVGSQSYTRPWQVPTGQAFRRCRLCRRAVSRACSGAPPRSPHPPASPAGGGRLHGAESAQACLWVPGDDACVT